MNRMRGRQLNSLSASSRTLCIATCGFAMLLTVAACSLLLPKAVQPQKLPEHAQPVRERPFMLGAEASLAEAAICVKAAAGPAMPDTSSEQVIIADIRIKPKTAKSSAGKKTKTASGLPAQVNLKSVITPEGDVITGEGWRPSHRAFNLAGCAPLKAIPFNQPVQLPIIAPAGEPYVLDLFFQFPGGGMWQSVRFVNFKQSPVLQQFVSRGQHQIGRPYVWGGINDFGLNTVRSRWKGRRVAGFDCSGLVKYLYQQQGVDIPWRTTAEQWNKLPPVQASDLLPGDLVFWADSRGRIYHVGIMLGDIGSDPDNDEPDGAWDMLHAPAKNQTVRVEYGFLNGPMRRGISGYRSW